MKIVKIFFPLFIMLFMLSHNVAFANDSASNQLIHILGSINSIEAKFTQKHKDSNTSQKIHGGRMLLEKPNKFRWQPNSSEGYVIIVDGKKIWHYDLELEQVLVQSLKSKADFTPMKLLLSEDLTWIEHEFDVKLTKKGVESCFNLKAKKSEEEQDIQACFRDNMLKKLQLRNELGQLIEFEFDIIKINKRIEPNNFKFVAPKGVDIIENEGR